ncbi:MAG: hypothetical protein FJ280_25195 [Planctomycetes bacterium]|nr:hypothetical protein [Planctomycetota bacterium]MBM4028664.1 hypothetical protein [Planctomycetota bacterium]
MFWVLVVAGAVAALVLSRRRLGWLGASWRLLAILLPGAVLGLLYVLRLDRGGVLSSLGQATGVPAVLLALGFVAFGALILAAALRALLEWLIPSRPDRRDGDNTNHGA